jgi:ribonucleoside-diphosphate reductase alpha chain
MYVTINFDEADTPFELFGNLGKAGGCDSAQLEAISRLVSLALRSGIEPATVIDQLRGITCCPAWDEGTLVRSGPDAVALALERHTGGEHGREEPGASDQVQLKFAPQVVTNGNGNGNGHEKGILNARKCPECNTPVIFEEGCMKCVACGWNKCE